MFASSSLIYRAGHLHVDNACIFTRMFAAVSVCVCKCRNFAVHEEPGRTETAPHGFLCCRETGTYGRHNSVRDSRGDSLLDSGFQVRREAPLPPLPLSEQPRVDVSDLVRPADLLLGSFGPVPLALDFSVVHPLHFNATLAEGTAGCAAERRAKEKEVGSKEVCRAVGWDFSPVVVETTGAWSSFTFTFVLVEAWPPGCQ